MMRQTLARRIPLAGMTRPLLMQRQVERAMTCWKLLFKTVSKCLYSLTSHPIDLRSIARFSTIRLKKIKVPLLPFKALVASQVRYLNLHEYQSKQLMAKHNVNVQRFAIAETVEQAENAARGLSK